MIKINFYKFISIILLISIILTLIGCQNKTIDDKSFENEIVEYSLIEYNYQFNPHVISEEYFLIYGKDIEEIFFSFCDALLDKEKEFKCESKEYFYQLLNISNSCFPIANEIIDKDKTYIENGICYLFYLYDDNELDLIINEFKERIIKIINESIKYDAPDYIKAIELYTTMVNKNKYDYDYTLDDALKIKSYRSIMENIGICQEFSGEYIYYLLQVGINAITCSALNNDKSEAHEWVLIKLEDEYYHIDPTYGINYPDSLFFFGLDDIQREYYGDFSSNSFTYANSDKIKLEADDRKFVEYWLAKSYEIDYFEKKIIIVDNNTLEKHEILFDE